MFKSGNRRLWRPLIAVVAAYALAVQSLLITLGGFTVLSHADVGATAFVLCAHDSDGPPAQPADAPDRRGYTHCIFCFAGSHHAVAGSPPVVLVRADAGVIIDIAWIADKNPLPGLSAHSIASPRGPPSRA